MKKIKFLVPLLALSFFSCDEYLDVNTNPNDLPTELVSPEKLLPAAQVGTYRTQITTMNQLGNLFTNAWAGNTKSYATPFAREFQLTIDNAFGTGIWDNLYLNVNNLQLIIDYNDPEGKYEYYKAIAKVLKAHYMQYIVDLYGDAPFREAFKGKANRTPAYTDDQVIYRDLLAGLDEAREAFEDVDPDTQESLEGIDVMLNGDTDTWTQFANTIELRFLLRMSNSTGAVATYRNSRIAALGKDFIATSVRINPGYSTNNDAQLNPFYGTFLFDAAGNELQNRTLITQSGHFYKSLRTTADYQTSTTAPEIIAGSGVTYPNVADPRRTSMWRTGVDQPIIRAVTQGSTNVDIYPPGQTEGLPARMASNMFNPNQEKTIGLALTNYASNSGYVMTLQEAKFLQAEASLRGWAGFGDAATLFNEGVTAALAHANVPAAAPTYLAAINTKPNFGFDPAFTFNQNLHAIMYQKWVGLAGYHGMESFIEYNRTGYPLTPLALTAAKTRKPRRLIYPVSEYVANSANVPNITPDNAFADTHPSHPFWMLGDPALGN